jgi:hypothetical protein
MAHGYWILADAGPESNKAGPLGLLTILALGIAVYFLYRSMVRHLKKVPDSFDTPTGSAGPAARASANGAAPSVAAATDSPPEPPRAP